MSTIDFGKTIRIDLKDLERGGGIDFSKMKIEEMQGENVDKHKDRVLSLPAKIVRVITTGFAILEAANVWMSIAQHGDIAHNVLWDKIGDLFTSGEIASANIDEVDDNGTIKIPTVDGQTMTITPEGTVIVSPTETPTQSVTATPNESETVRKQVEEDFAKYGFVLRPGDQTIKEGSSIKVVGVVKHADGIKTETIYENGKFNIRYIVENLKPETLDKTNIEPINGDRRNASRKVDGYNAETYNYHSEFLEQLIGFNEGDKISIPGILLYEYQDGNNYAWGFSLSIKRPNETSFTGQYLVFKNANGELVTYPIQDISSVDVADFYDN